MILCVNHKPINITNYYRLIYPEKYARGSVTTGRAYHARQVKGDDPDKKGNTGHPGWGLGVRLTTPPYKIYVFCLAAYKKIRG